MELDKQGRWGLVKPIVAEADSLEVEGVLSMLESMIGKRRLPAENLSRYGLEHPTAIWRMGLKDGRSFELRVGKTSSYNQDLYAMRADEPKQVLVLESHVAPGLLLHAVDLRQRSLMPLNAEQVGRLELELGGVVYLLEKQAGRWKMLKPIDDRADEQRVGRLLNLLANLQAKRFVDGEVKLSTYGLESPRVKLRLASTAETEWSYELIFGRGTLKVNDQKVFVRRLKPDGPLAEVRGHILSGLKLDFFDLQAKNPMDFQPNRVQRIKISGPKGLLVIERGEGEGQVWNLVAPMPAAAKSYKILSLLESLRRLRASRFLGVADEARLERYGLATADLHIALFDVNDKEISRLSIGKALDKGVAVLGSQRPEICLVPAKQLESLPRDPESLRLDSPGQAPPVKALPSQKP